MELGQRCFTRSFCQGDDDTEVTLWERIGGTRTSLGSEKRRDRHKEKTTAGSGKIHAVRRVRKRADYIYTFVTTGICQLKVKW